VQDLLTNPTDYSVSNSNVVTVDIWPSGYTLVIKRVVDEKQESNYTDVTPMDSERVEGDFDSSVKLIQRLSEKLDRSLLLPETSPNINIEFPEPEDEYFLQWDGVTLRNVRVVKTGSLALLAFMTAFLTSADADAAFEALGADADWHLVGGVGEPAFQNGWANSGAPYESLSFRIDAEGIIHLKGRVTGGGIDSVIFTLPVGYRPSATQTIHTALEGTGNIEIASNGEVKIIS
jgi:hypothetical protein